MRIQHALVIVVGLSLSVGGLAACGDGADRASAAPEEELIGGKVAPADAFPATMHVVGNCTVTKVGANLVLTAAHCVRDSGGRVRPEFTTGSSMSIIARGDAPGRRTLGISRTILHPQIEHVCRTRGCSGRASSEKRDAPDVALIEVTGGLDDIPIAEVDLEPALPGEQVTILGYGCTGNVQGNGDGQLRYLDTRIVDVRAAAHNGGLSASDTEGLATIEANYNVTPGPTRPERVVPVVDGGAVDAGAGDLVPAAGLCPGDSGGALYRKDTNRIVGVNASYTFLPGGDVPVTNWQARVDADSRWGVAAWLESFGVKTVRTCAERGCTPPASAARSDGPRDGG